MNKSKIAISIDQSLLDLVDSFVDNEKISSRSHAVEYLLKQALKQRPVTEAVILMLPERVKTLFNEFEGFSLIQHHLNLLNQAGIKEIYLITKVTKELEEFAKKLTKVKINLINQDKPTGTGSSLKLLKDKLSNDFVVMNGDTINEFNLRSMISKHLDSGRLGTLGLISSDKAGQYGAVKLDGDLVVDFKEKSSSESFIINAGIYIFKPKIFDVLSGKSLEKDLFPELAKKKELVGFFTYGQYYHF